MVSFHGGRRLFRATLRILVVFLVAAATGSVAFAGGASAADATPGGKLFAGGNFTAAGGITATRVAAWNGVDWSALTGPNAEGVDGQVTAMTTFQGKLIVAGSFMEAGGETVSGIASWDGVRWEPLVGSTGAIGVAIRPLGFVSSLAVYNGDLYVGGLFQRAGGLVVNNIARWNGSDWSAVAGPSGFGLTNFGSDIAVAWDMTTVDGQLVVVGEFTEAGGVAANSVAAWNGSTWSSLGQPIESVTILAAAAYNGRLVVGRGYSENNLSVDDVAWRDGGQWSTLGDRLDGGVRDFTIHNGQLVAGGQFTRVGDRTVNRVAAWNGTAWSALSGPSEVGTNGDVFAVASHWGHLFAGGFFSQAGGVPVENVARWTGGAWSAVPGGGANDTVFELLST